MDLWHDQRCRLCENTLLSLDGFYERFDVLGGDSWFVPHYNKVGFKLAKQKRYKTAKYDFMSLSISYLFAPHDFNCVEATLGFNF